MTTNRGFQPIPRTWFGSVQWHCKRTFNHLEALIWLLEKSAYVDGRRVQISANRSITLRRGQIATTRRELSERWGWSQSTVARFLKQFAQAGVFPDSPVIATEVIRCGAVGGEVGGEVGGAKYGTTLTLITLCNYDYIVGATNGGGEVDGAVGGGVGGEVGGESIYSIEKKNKESYKKRENECVEKEKKGDTRTHTHSQNFNNHIVSTTDCVVGAAHGISDDEKIVAERAAKPMKSVDDPSQEKENVAPKEKEGGSAGTAGMSVSRSVGATVSAGRSGITGAAGAARAGITGSAGAGTASARQAGVVSAGAGTNTTVGTSTTAGTGTTMGTNTTAGTGTTMGTNTTAGTGTTTATQPAKSAMFALPGATEREIVRGRELLQWFRTEYPDLAAMQYPMTLEQAVWLLRSYSLPDIRFVIDRMRSKEAFRNNTAFYSTFIAFARRDKDIVRLDAPKVYRG